ncbi:proteasomal ubiquitin receptor ADRM1 homolog isoform X1 [Chelonus insularis]|uniref:proteasomal ubiquitin receptor ADRM1 homolog isoform X1 n=1 Tax=Chelonus insularis TaxID=460826 RepID=UPI00158D4E0A|nr:proteasomal ubiquitin receptor ADRM1 homolog isoform X1 [Chelonus insularis]
MSSGALFSNNTVRGANKNIVEFKAGKMTMKGKMVYPDTRKGLLYVYQSDDSLMHLCWKDRTSGVTEDDLIIFPDDCEFKHVPECKTGRVYLLRFKISSKKFFFWLQDIKTEKDEEYCKRINEVLNNPPTPGSQRSGGPNPDGDLQNLLNNMSQQQLMQLFGGVGQIGLGSLLGTMRERPQHSRSSTTTAPSTPVTTSVTRPPAAQTPAPPAVTSAEGIRSSSSGNSKNSGSKSGSNNSMSLSERNQPMNINPDLFEFERHLWSMSTPLGSEPVHQRDIARELTNSIPTAIVPTKSLQQAMSKHLPPGDNLCMTLASPQFYQALSMFWSALQSGQAGPVVRQFGLGPDAVNAAATGNLESFVTALESETKKEAEDGQSSAATPKAAEDDATKKESPSTAAKAEEKSDKDDEMTLD